MSKRKYEATAKAETNRTRRMTWWRRSRFGMFVHWGLYSQLGRHEWVMNRERIPRQQYARLAKTWKPKPRAARDWAKLARDAGMKYMVMTTKHHEGFCLWDTRQTDYNAVKRGPGRDLVAEYVDACREFGLKVGFYYSLLDWHHPDGHTCATNAAARKRFVAFTHGCVEELMSHYGKIDILWYDVPEPLATPKAWGSAAMNEMVRRLQPHILINNRSRLDEDFGTPEEHIRAEQAGRAWEACMTFNGSWGYMPSAPDEDWHSARDVVKMLRQVTGGAGNLLLNIGPKPDGSVPDEACPRLRTVGKWLDKYDQCVYGDVDRADELVGMPFGSFTRKGRTAFFWADRWVGREMTIGGVRGKVKAVELIGSRRKVRFRQKGERLMVSNLPATCPDKLVGIAPIAITFAGKPRQIWAASYPAGR
ncbi:MAG: alpha-L-fucosidase [Phycisphaerae bacterium]|nr:alpha-L-fucosidase [Phycisphaerae bacterium]